MSNIRKWPDGGHGHETSRLSVRVYGVNIEYVCHATTLIELNGIQVITDPWIRGQCYLDQWNLFPRPVHEFEKLDKSDVILISHGHEDHLHEESLKQFGKDKQVFYPYQWIGGTRDFLKDIGFTDVVEAVSGKKYCIGKGVYVTYIPNNLNSILILESGGKVIVNLNDALHSQSRSVIEKFTDYIIKKWKKIDVLICGFGGASSYPNCIHIDDKNDLEIARAREEYFAYNFCLITKLLSPEISIPFAADFVLLGENQRWMNKARFQKSNMQKLFSKSFGQSKTKILAMFPGDKLEDGLLVKSSPYRLLFKKGRLEHIIEQDYIEEIEQRENIPIIQQKELDSLVSDIRKNINTRLKILGSAKLESVCFSIILEDVKKDNIINVVIGKGVAEVMQDRNVLSKRHLDIQTRASVLSRSLEDVWTGDVITIGYALDMYIYEKSIAMNGLEMLIMRLLTKHPQASLHYTKEPVRWTKYMLQNPLTTGWALKQLLYPKAISTKSGVTYGNHWITKSKCEICGICDFPLLDDEFFHQG